MRRCVLAPCLGKTAQPCHASPTKVEPQARAPQSVRAAAALQLCRNRTHTAARVRALHRRPHRHLRRRGAPRAKMEPAELGSTGIRRQSGLPQRLDQLSGCVRNRVQIVHEDWGGNLVLYQEVFEVFSCENRLALSVAAESVRGRGDGTMQQHCDRSWTPSNLRSCWPVGETRPSKPTVVHVPRLVVEQHGEAGE